MLDRKYGKCLSYLCQIFGKTYLKMAKWDFHYKMAIFWQFDLISYFFHTFNFFKFDN